MSLFYGVWFAEPPAPKEQRRNREIPIMDYEEATIEDSPQITDEDLGGLDPIERAFWEFHRDNPNVYIELRGMALGLHGRGYDHYGIKALCEVLRFNRVMETDIADDTFKINNNYSALYARLLMRHEPRLSEFFETRERISRRSLKQVEAA